MKKSFVLVFVQVFSDALYRFCLALNVLIAYCHQVSNFFLLILIHNKEYLKFNSIGKILI